MKKSISLLIMFIIGSAFLIVNEKRDEGKLSIDAGFPDGNIIFESTLKR